MDVALVSRFAALLALAAGLGAVVLGAALLLPGGPLRGLRQALQPVALGLAFAVAATAMAGSLYFSEVAHLVPCKLCWFQRIAMYPLAVILGIAALRRDPSVRRYAIPLAALGAVVSIYHVQLERFPNQSTFCSVEAPCSLPPVEELGFVTLATMALCGFLAVIALLVAIDRPRSTREHTSTSLDQPREESFA